MNQKYVFVLNSDLSSKSIKRTLAIVKERGAFFPCLGKVQSWQWVHLKRCNMKSKQRWVDRTSRVRFAKERWPLSSVPWSHLKQNPCPAYLPQYPGDLSSNWCCLQSVCCRHNTTSHFFHAKEATLPCSENLKGTPSSFLEHSFRENKIVTLYYGLRGFSGWSFSDNTIF